MKQGIHPEYVTTTIVCACGNRFDTKSTQDGEIHVEICSVCHPFYTGKQRLVDTAGRVERFKRKYGDTSLRGGEDEDEAEDGAEEPTADEDGTGEAAAEAAPEPGKVEKGTRPGKKSGKAGKEKATAGATASPPSSSADEAPGAEGSGDEASGSDE